MEFTPHQVRVYQNSCTKIYEEVELNSLKDVYNELVSLCDLFAYSDTEEKEKLMKKKKQNYTKRFKPDIDKMSRLLRNRR